VSRYQLTARPFDISIPKPLKWLVSPFLSVNHFLTLLAIASGDTQSILDARMPDEMFSEESRAMKAVGRSIHLIDTEVIASCPSRVRPPFEPGARVGRTVEPAGGLAGVSWRKR
jgi:hypothetical protein